MLMPRGRGELEGSVNASGVGKGVKVGKLDLEYRGLVESAAAGSEL